MRSPLSVGLTVVAAVFAVTLVATSTQTRAQTLEVLHSFGTPSDGFHPFGSVVFDKSGNLYGATFAGGVDDDGTVFELRPKVGGAWGEEVLHSFNLNGKDGTLPYSTVILDAARNLYGTTWTGGTNTVGTVFELVRKAGGGWSEKILHDFNYHGTGGYEPYAGLVFDAFGNLYGTTFNGGTGSCTGDKITGCGTVFELTPKAGGGWTPSILHNFNDNGTDGGNPHGSLILDAHGNLYGTTSAGGIGSCTPDGYAPDGCGVVFELSPSAGGSWTESILHSFNNDGTDGFAPDGGLVFDTSGNLYGTTNQGGAYNYGTVFELTPTGSGSWTETVLHNFGASGDGTYPGEGSLLLDTSGNLYGTTFEGGTGACIDYNEGPVIGCGTVFELTPTGGGVWTETVLTNFEDSATDGYWPFSGLIFDALGNLYGTASQGGVNREGTLFEITP